MLLGAPWAAPAAAQGISSKNAICDPKFPDRCIKPAADGSIAVTGGGGGSGTAGVKANASPPTWIEGSTTNQQSGNLHGATRVLPMTPAGADFDLSAPADIQKVVVATDKSGTLTTGGVAQNAIASNASRKGWCITNDAASGEILYVNTAGTASATTGTPLAVGAQTCNLPGMVTTGAISVFAATTAHRWYGVELQ